MKDVTPQLSVPQMKSVLFHGPKDIRLEESPIPALAEGEVLVKVEAALTGGTDIKTYLRGHPKIIKEIPSAFGYEFSGIIEDLNGVENFQIGDRIVAANTAPCYECFFCKKEEHELCENLDFLNGSFAEYIKIPARIAKHNLYKIPGDLDFKSAAATQTLAVALHGFQKSQIKAGDIVVVYGLGAIGQCFVKLCKMHGAKVFAIGRSQLKLDLAKANKADLVLNANDDIEEKIKELTQGYGADVVIEAVGKPETWSQALKLVRPGGLVNFFGGCPKGTSIELDTFQAHYQELRTVGTFHHSPKYIKEALDLIANAKITMEDLITHEMLLSDLEEALEKSMNGDALKVLIKNANQ